MTDPTTTADDVANASCDRRFPPKFRAAQSTNETVRAWTTGHARPALMLIGPVGVGKTWNAYGALRETVVRLYNEAIRRQRADPTANRPDHLTPRGALRWEAISVPDLLDDLRPGATAPEDNPREVMARHRSASALLLDDLAAQRDSDFTEEQLFRLINYRYEYELPTIFTSNAVPKQIGAALGARIADRLTEMCEIVVLNGDSRRAR
jgi:DNA replication protein DnaC